MLRLRSVHRAHSSASASTVRGRGGGLLGWGGLVQDSSADTTLRRTSSIPRCNNVHCRYIHAGAANAAEAASSSSSSSSSDTGAGGSSGGRPPHSRPHRSGPRSSDPSAPKEWSRKRRDNTLRQPFPSPPSQSSQASPQQQQQAVRVQLSMAKSGPVGVQFPSLRRTMTGSEGGVALGVGDAMPVEGSFPSSPSSLSSDSVPLHLLLLHRLTQLHEASLPGSLRPGSGSGPGGAMLSGEQMEQGALVCRTIERLVTEQRRSVGLGSATKEGMTTTTTTTAQLQESPQGSEGQAQAESHQANADSAPITPNASLPATTTTAPCPPFALTAAQFPIMLQLLHKLPRQSLSLATIRAVWASMLLQVELPSIVQKLARTGTADENNKGSSTVILSTPYVPPTRSVNMVLDMMCALNAMEDAWRIWEHLVKRAKGNEHDHNLTPSLISLNTIHRGIIGRIRKLQAELNAVNSKGGSGGVRPGDKIDRQRRISKQIEQEKGRFLKAWEQYETIKTSPIRPPASARASTPPSTTKPSSNISNNSIPSSSVLSSKQMAKNLALADEIESILADTSNTTVTRQKKPSSSSGVTARTSSSTSSPATHSSYIEPLPAILQPLVGFFPNAEAATKAFSPPFPYTSVGLDPYFHGQVLTFFRTTGDVFKTIGWVLQAKAKGARVRVSSMSHDSDEELGENDPLSVHRFDGEAGGEQSFSSFLDTHDQDRTVVLAEHYALWEQAMQSIYQQAQVPVAKTNDEDTLALGDFDPHAVLAAKHPQSLLPQLGNIIWDYFEQSLSSSHPSRPPPVGLVMLRLKALASEGKYESALRMTAKYTGIFPPSDSPAQTVPLLTPPKEASIVPGSPHLHRNGRTLKPSGKRAQREATNYADLYSVMISILRKASVEEVALVLGLSFSAESRQSLWQPASEAEGFSTTAAPFNSVLTVLPLSLGSPSSPSAASNPRLFYLAHLLRPLLQSPITMDLLKHEFFCQLVLLYAQAYEEQREERRKAICNSVGFPSTATTISSINNAAHSLPSPAVGTSTSVSSPFLSAALAPPHPPNSELWLIFWHMQQCLPSMEHTRSSFALQMLRLESLVLVMENLHYMLPAND